ncbi:tyrosine-type recombinase/integrase [Peptoniphilus equinus]|uniref:Tyrosine-type recombinase/integrase n=1 Tax=Peptoniphilus equinus TaxID=3016343 RepID=A0ABY7QRA4_9FIRM|nr:tyrosine-type recombinase/integrase [Peptoniphilus equinus]WBW49302.1 tyrosine-type recombinase/integrase [Peptoniphilus equinus]
MVERRKDNKNRVLKEGEYQRKNGTYEYRWREKTGKRKYIYAKTLDELRIKETEILSDYYSGKKNNDKLDINFFYERWKTVKRGLQPNTFANYVYMYKRFIVDDFGKIKINDLKKSDIREFYIKLNENYGLHISTIEVVQNILHQILEIAVDDDYLIKNPSDNALKELKQSKGNVAQTKKALSLEAQEVLENYLKNEKKYYRWYPIIITFLWTGMRAGELTGLRYQDIDMENKIIDVNHTLVYYKNVGDKKLSRSIHTPKTEAGIRKIPMLDKVIEAIKLEKDMQVAEDSECKEVIDGYTDFIFLNRFGVPHEARALNKTLARIVRDCNFWILDNMKKGEEPLIIPRISCHSLRHTFTTRMCEQNLNLKVMQDILGHKDFTTTMNIYAEVNGNFAQKEMQKLNEFSKKFK